MDRFKSFLFLLLCFGLGIGLATAYTHFLHHTPTPEISQHGTGAPPLLRGFSLPPTVNPTLFDALLPLHTTAVALEYPSTLESLAAAVHHAHTLGQKVLLQPAPNFSPKNPYPKPLTQIAADAEAANVDILTISWLNADPDPIYWQSEITKIRTLFHGQILLATTSPILPGIDFTSATDLLGVIGPIDLPRRLPHANDSINLHDLQIAWNCHLDSFESIGNKTGKKILLLNMVVPPSNSTKIGSDNPPPDPILQSLIYQALLTETHGRPMIYAIFLKWTPEATPQTTSPDPLAANHLPALLTQINTLWVPIAPAATAPSDPDSDNDSDTDSDADNDTAP